ncbi:MAG: flagellar motor switch protein FliM [Rhodobiaceae bacterium]|nr:flagellar motor switch protein FliM [Rhodobiaceae bacterium]MCC0012198.1 flagellar motor switch protein FliM [Rhodobiaceae bacterium]MCC0050946.1 flagellar motor switch protein FliM [Rhodobiaceae bacterium]MCC0060887.1 flagellar motor switch protein FliM [Rhodobiaceae bacterium]
MANEPVDQDELAAAWGADLDDDGGSGAVDQDGMASAWESMIDDPGGRQADNGKGAERVLNQDEIDNLLGFNVDELSRDERQGIRAIINSALVSYERLPMLEILFDRLVRLMTTSLRNFTSDNVEVSLDGLRSIRFGDYLNSIPLPAMLGVFKAEEWDNYGLITVESGLIYAMVDVLLGGRRGQGQLRVEGRPYTTIESNLIRRMMEVILEDMDDAFSPLSPVHFNIERLETNPRFAAIARPANAAVLVRLRVDMEDRGGNVEVLLPYATIEPIRGLLLQMFMGEKFGRDATWEGHLASQMWAAHVGLDAVLFEVDLPLSRAMNFSVGDTIPLDIRPDDLVTLKCGDVVLTDGRVGRIGDKIAVRVASSLRRPKMTYAAFEQAEQLAGE